MTARGGSSRRAVVLLSGEGTNLQAFIDAVARGEVDMEIAAVVSNRAEARGLGRARRAGIEAQCLEPARSEDRAGYDGKLAAIIESYQPAIILLAGFMRILGREFVERFQGRMLNIHPSLLPAYRGLHTHRRVLEAGERMHGATVHFVTEELDGGPAVLQARVPILEGDDEARLSGRVQAAEHIIYPRAAGWLASGRLGLSGDTVTLDDVPLGAPVVMEWSGQDETCFPPEH